MKKKHTDNEIMTRADTIQPITAAVLRRSAEKSQTAHRSEYQRTLRKTEWDNKI